MLNNSKFSNEIQKGGSPQQSTVPPPIQDSIDQLKHLLKKIKFNRQLHSKDFLTGSISVYIPIIHYSLLIYSKLVTKFIEQKGYILQTKNDHQFMEDVYSLLDKHFTYKVPLSLNQFFLNGFIDQKIGFCIDLIKMVKNKHQMLSKRSSSVKENINHYEKSERHSLGVNNGMHHNDEKIDLQLQQQVNITKKQNNKANEANMRGTKSVRFLEQQNKAVNGEKVISQEPLKDKRNFTNINSTIDSSMDKSKISFIEVDNYLKRAGSPQPTSTYEQKRHSMGAILKSNNKQGSDQLTNIRPPAQNESCPVTTRGTESFKQPLQLLINDPKTDAMRDIGGKIESQRSDNSKNIVFETQSKSNLKAQQDKHTQPSSRSKHSEFQQKEGGHQQQSHTHFEYKTYSNYQSKQQSSNPQTSQPKTQVYDQNKQIELLITRNKDLETKVTQLHDSVRVIIQNFQTFQNYVEDKINQLEVENTDLKNRLLNNEKQRLQSDRSNSLISPLQSKPSIDFRTKEDNGVTNFKKDSQKVETLYSQYSSRYRSEKRQTTQNSGTIDNTKNIQIQPMSQLDKYDSNRYLDEEYLQNLRKNYSHLGGSNGFQSNRVTEKSERKDDLNGLRATGEFRPLDEKNHPGVDRKLQHKNMSSSSGFADQKRQSFKRGERHMFSEVSMNNIENTFGGGAANQAARVDSQKNMGSDFVSLRSKSNERDSVNRGSAGAESIANRWAQSRPSYYHHLYQDRETVKNQQRLGYEEQRRKLLANRYD
ncbi:UNKNOWN [Stylonychia lemnae]|uniref:Centrosomal protein of 44 kDa n=1 Tax=Stylonychia lemnae TaxID=5949 RepID=A0A078B0L2_STYLE|nr:UNKNOWN [Stylonychia lemnae]|eukprot:CDW88195.1 UNKNOWN [Stylonychia lemnae]